MDIYRKKYWVLIVFIFLGIKISYGQMDYEQLKAILIVKMAQGITWENQENINTYRIGFLGNDSVTFKTLESLTLKEEIHGKSIKPVLINNLSYLPDIQILYVNQAEGKNIVKIWEYIESNNILLITEQCKDKKYIMLNIIYDQAKQKVSFEINKANVIIEDLIIEPELMLLGGTEVDIRELYRNIRAEQEHEKEIIQTQRDTIFNQLGIINDYTRKLDRLTSEIQRMEFDKSKSQHELKSLSISIEEQQKQIKYQKDQIAEYSYNLNKKESELHKQEIHINEHNSILDSLNNERKIQQNIIKDQEKTINTKETLINTQKYILILSIFSVFLLLILALSIYNAYRTKKQTNDMLEEKVELRTEDLQIANNRLKHEIGERIKIENDLQISNKRYQSLFENAPVSVWEEDFSEVKKLLDSFKIQNDGEKELFLDRNPEIVSKCISKMQIIDINKETLRMYKALNKDDLIYNMNDSFTPENINIFKKELLALWKGVKHQEVEARLPSSNGNELDVIVRWNVLPGYEENYKRILVTIIDISELKHAKTELEQYKNQLENLVKQRTKELEISNHNLVNTIEELNSTNEQIEYQKIELETMLLTLKNTQSKLVQTEKMASLGLLTAGVAHEINNPLNFISGGLQAIKSYLKESGPEHYNNVKLWVSHIQTGVDRATDIVRGLSQFSRGTKGQNEICDINAIVNNCLIILQNQLKYKVEMTHKNVADNTKIIGNTGQLHQVFLNLIVNAEQAISDQGSISIKISDNNNNVFVAITDSGSGIEKDKMDKIFEPFFTTKSPGKGTGLGLSITYNIVKEHNGEIFFKSELNKGTTATIKLPKNNVNKK